MQPIASYFFLIVCHVKVKHPDMASLRTISAATGWQCRYMFIGWCLTPGPSGSRYPYQQGIDHAKKKFKKPSLLLFYAYIATDCIL